MQLAAQRVPRRQRLLFERATRPVAEHVTVPRAAFQRQRLRVEDLDCLAEKCLQLGRIQQRGFPVGLGLIDALACLGCLPEDVPYRIILRPTVEDAHRTNGQPKEHLRGGVVTQRVPRSL
jgi:hypothetical protein